MSSETEEPDFQVDEGSSQEELDRALLNCAARGTYSEAKRLLHLGAKADVLIENRQGKTRSALGNATYRGHYQLVKLFLDHGADPDAGDDLTWRPIVEAIFCDDERMVKLLLEGGADPNVEINRWNVVQSPMHAVLTSRCSNPEVLRVLLNYGGNPNIEHGEYCRPLHCMAQVGGGDREYDKLKVLLEEGENVYIDPKDEYGRTPIEVAIYEGNRDTLETMLRFDMLRELDNHRWLHVAAERGNRAMVKYLVKERNCDINGLCRGATPLQVALDEHSIHVAQWFRKHGGQIGPAHSDSKCPCQENSDSD